MLCGLCAKEAQIHGCHIVSLLVDLGWELVVEDLYPIYDAVMFTLKVNVLLCSRDIL